MTDGTMNAIDAVNAMPASEAREALLRCCGSGRWADALLARRPFASAGALREAAESIWLGLSEADWLEAFSRHPRIGNAKDVTEKAGAERRWSSGEQAGAAGVDEQVLSELAEKNDAYARKFGFIFIVCATGKSGSEMLSMLRERLEHDRPAEIRTAAREQAKIMQIRLEKWLVEIAS